MKLLILGGIIVGIVFFINLLMKYRDTMVRLAMARSDLDKLQSEKRDLEDSEAKNIERIQQLERAEPLSVIVSKKELYDLYNILEIALFDFEDNEDELPDEILDMIKATESVIMKIKNLYQGLEDEATVSLKMNAEEALIIVKQLKADIKEHEEKIGVEEDPTSYNAERAYHMHNLKERIQEYFSEKLRDLLPCD